MGGDGLINTVIRKRYRILQFLGVGSFGDTYIAEDIDLPGNPKCVVKQLKPKTSQQEVLMVARRLFNSEAEVLYRLDNLSDQIPKLFAHFEENGEFYLVQEFVDGYNLTAEIIPGSQWSESEVIKLLQEILEVLTIVHQKNIIHRDIKPENLVRRREDGKIVLIDFGAVKEIRGLAANTQGQVNSTIAIGSNGYMPNEQANSKPKLCSDIYAVGVIGIQALTGKLPQDFLEDSTNGEIIWRNEVKVSNRLSDVLTKMVRYDFSQRYQTAAEALQALKSIPSISPSLSLLIFTLLRSAFNRQKILITAVTGVSLLLGVGLLQFILNTARTKPPVVNSKPVETFPGTSPHADPDRIEPIANIKLVCPEKTTPSLPIAPDWETKSAKYYGLPKNSQTGKGILILLDRRSGKFGRYDGEFKDGRLNGCGMFKHADGDRYIGQFENGRFQGVGKAINTNGTQYEGEFKNNLFHGRGIFRFANGDRYVGQFENGKFQGVGKIINTNGTQYEGEFKNNLFHGRGIFRFANGDRYIGQFENGKSQGVGRWICKNGSEYKGEFRDNKICG